MTNKQHKIKKNKIFWYCSGFPSIESEIEVFDYGRPLYLFLVKYNWIKQGKQKHFAFSFFLVS